METLQYKKWTGVLEFQRYHSGNFAIHMVDSNNGEQIAVFTRNFPELLDTQVAIDVNNCGTEAVLLLIKAGITKSSYPDRFIVSGFCTYPVYSLSDKALESWAGID